MKIAIFHNFLDNIGGAEIVALTLAKELNADLYTTNVDSDKIKKMGFEEVLPRIKSLGKIPKNAPFRHQLAFWKFRRLNLGKKYDFYIIAGDWAMSGVVNNKPNLWYVHSPLNELWAFKDYVRNKVIEKWKRPLFDIWVWFNRRLNKKYAKHAQIIVCNSINTQNRIKKYYNRNAIVINPPIETSRYHYEKNKGYWLAVNRLTKAKRIELQMRAFAKLPNENLVIVGSYEKGSRPFENYKKYVESIKPQNVKILNWAEDKTLKELYTNCKGFITTSRDEDFGMTPIEAMAAGKPVIAPNEGGYKETIINGKTGILIDEINSDKIVEAIKIIGKNPKKYKAACLKQAKKFDTKEFIKKIKEEMQ
jgi:glycosyltransferase involved in cell wall biosynthesis